MPEIELDLGRHCIETATRRRYNRLLSEYFRGRQGDPELEARLELLQKALTDLDFPSLRAAYKELCGNTAARVVLTAVGGRPVVSIDGQMVGAARRSRPGTRT